MTSLPGWGWNRRHLVPTAGRKGLGDGYLLPMTQVHVLTRSNQQSCNAAAPICSTRCPWATYFASPSSRLNRCPSLVHCCSECSLGGQESSSDVLQRVSHSNRSRMAPKFALQALRVSLLASRLKSASRGKRGRGGIHLPHTPHPLVRSRIAKD